MTQKILFPFNYFQAVIMLSQFCMQMSRESIKILSNEP